MTTETSHFTVEETEGVTVLSFRRNIISDEGAVLVMGNQLMTLAERSERILLDFSSLTSITSATLPKFIRLYKRMLERQGKLRFCAMNPDVRFLFRFTYLDKTMDIVDADKATALIGM